MELKISATASMAVREIKDGNELTTTMKSGLLVINEVEIPFVLQRTFSKRTVKEYSIGFFGEVYVVNVNNRETRFTKQGYRSFLITTGASGNLLQVYVYVKKDDCPKFINALCSYSLK